MKNKTNEPIAIDDAEALAEQLYTFYREAVGLKDWSGKPLPDWAVFRIDQERCKQSDAWVAMAEKFSLEALAELRELRKALICERANAERWYRIYQNNADSRDGAEGELRELREWTSQTMPIVRELKSVLQANPELKRHFSGAVAANPLLQAPQKMSAGAVALSVE